MSINENDVETFKSSSIWVYNLVLTAVCSNHTHCTVTIGSRSGWQIRETVREMDFACVCVCVYWAIAPFSYRADVNFFSHHII